MRWFSLKGTLVFCFLLCLVVASIRYVSDYYSLYYIGIILKFVAPLPLLIYGLVYYWKLNKGEAKLP